ncbi:flavin reductase family protein [Streptomyces sp. NBC_00075]|uniref:flavin reductase family protein n=1 Tax=Streptomyces sp. NBC_00075 TaxID=2975641 RepID=UPI0038688DF1
MVWLSRANRTYRVALRAERLTVHGLRRDQDRLARLFGGETGDRTDKFTGVAWHPGPAGSPVLDEAPAWFVGRVENRIDGGDHVGFLLAPEAAENVVGDRTTLLSLKDAHGITPGSSGGLTATPLRVRRAGRRTGCPCRSGCPARRGSPGCRDASRGRTPERP